MLKSLLSGVIAAACLVAGSAAAQSYDTAITLTATPTQVEPGDDVTFVFQVTNTGPGAATDANVGLTPMFPMRFVSLTAPGSYSCATPAVGSMGGLVCSRTSIPAGANDQFTAVYNVASNSPSPITTGANAVVSDSFTADVDMSNNEADQPIQIGTATPPPPPPVPTLSEWAMLLFGTLLAGGSALYLQRRRPAA